jgi:hypothetical protein
MAASSPLHRDASASREPSSHSMYCMPATNAAPPSHTFERLVGPLRPWSDRRSCGGPLRPRSLPFAHALRADARTKTGACGRTVRMPPCNRICQATTMRRTAGIKNKIASRVARRETRRDLCTPYLYVTHTKKALATPRRPYSPEGRCAWTRPQHAYASLNGRPERILPGHLGPAGAPRGGRRHAATIMGLEGNTGQPRGSGLAQAAQERLQLTGMPSWAPWRRQADGERCPTPRHARAPHCRKKTSTPASNAACEGATRRPAPSEPACTPLQRKRLETSEFGKHSPKPPRLRACCCRRRPATPSPPLARASAG